MAHKVAPAIAAGCPVVLKPASQTPLSAVNLGRLLVDECGLPAEWLHVLPGKASEVGNAIVEHDGIALISFTGSSEVGWGIRQRAFKKKVGLELGNNAPVIIEPDGDWKTAAAKISVAGFSHAGQSCISTQRVYVHADVEADFLGELVPRVEKLVVGDPLDENTDVSALISTGDRDRVLEWIEEAAAQGAEVLTGGKVEGNLLLPTVLRDVTPDMKVCREEVFGPVVGVQTYTDLDEALRLANDTKYGLQAAVFTANIERALRAADARLRRRARQRGADVAGRPDALRRRARQRQHARGPRLRRAGDDRAAPGGRAGVVAPDPRRWRRWRPSPARCRRTTTPTRTR